MKRRYNIFVANQKQFVKIRNGCNEHIIIMNEPLHDAPRQRKKLFVMMIDLTKAFAS
jgi:hypothetical protein